MSTTRRARARTPTARGDLPGRVFAFSGKRKEPLTDASHVRNALARFNQVSGVSDSERARAFARIRRAGKRFGVKISETHWRQLMR
jgi:hypothetical protein